MIKWASRKIEKKEKEKRSKEALGGLKRERVRRGIVVSELFSFR